MKPAYLAAAASFTFISAALAEPHPQRIRGTVTSIASDSLVVHPATGPDVTIALGSGTKYATVTKASLSDINKDSYIGTATKGSGATLVALEVVVFAPSMRGVGDGHYDWDKITDTTLSGDHKTASAMTNGNVDQASAPPGGTKVKSSMTNGNVDTSAEKGGAKQLVVSYKGGKQTIVVPPTAPVVNLEPAEMSAVTAGAPVFVIASDDDGKLSGGLVAVGKGVTPPM